MALQRINKSCGAAAKSSQEHDMKETLTGVGYFLFYLAVLASYGAGLVASFIHSTWLFLICLFLPPVSLIYGGFILFQRLVG